MENGTPQAQRFGRARARTSEPGVAQARQQLRVRLALQHPAESQHRQREIEGTSHIGRTRRSTLYCAASTWPGTAERRTRYGHTARRHLRSFQNDPDTRTVAHLHAGVKIASVTGKEHYLSLKKALAKAHRSPRKLSPRRAAQPHSWPGGCPRSQRAGEDGVATRHIPARSPASHQGAAQPHRAFGYPRIAKTQRYPSLSVALRQPYAPARATSAKYRSAAVLATLRSLRTSPCWHLAAEKRNKVLKIATSPLSTLQPGGRECASDCSENSAKPNVSSVTDHCDWLPASSPAHNRHAAPCVS